MLRSPSHTARLVLGRGLVRPRPRTRNFATETIPPSATGTLPPPPPPPKKRFGFISTVVIYSSVLTLGFYAGSTVVALGSEEYRNWFIERMPFAERVMEFTDSHGWDRAVVKTKAAGDKVIRSASRLERKIEEALPKPAQDAITSTKEAVKASGRKVSEVAHDISDKTQKAASDTLGAAKERSAKLKESARAAMGKATPSGGATTTVPRPSDFSEGVEELVQKAEEALKITVANVLPTSSVPPLGEPGPAEPKPAPAVVPTEVVEALDPTIWTQPLPLGFEPPPGYKLPKPKAKASSPPPKLPPVEGSSQLPLIAPTVSSLVSTEPIIGQLAATIDTLSALVASTPTASEQAKAALAEARTELETLAKKINATRSAERERLGKKLAELTAGFNKKVMELEMSSKEKSDSQEETWKQAFDDERQKVVSSYKERLEAELETQSAIINERLKAEIIAQGVEMQRRWTRDIKVRVEQEREGRLSKLEELASSLQKLERLTLDNSAYLDDNLQLHAFWASLRALEKSIESPTRTPFREELRTLRSAISSKQDPIFNTVLETLEASTTPDVGIEPLADLTTWFSSAVAPRLFSVALVPDQNAGVLSHLAATALSSLQFRRRGLVDGTDVLSVVSRAEYYLNEKNLDAAARELNQLQGPAKALLSDWLEAARRRLEVEQAFQVLQSQATFSSLLVL